MIAAIGTLASFLSASSTLAAPIAGCTGNPHEHEPEPPGEPGPTGNPHETIPDQGTNGPTGNPHDETFSLCHGAKP